MAFEYTVDHRVGYSVVRIESDPSLDDFLRFVERIGVESRTWPVRRGLVDLRSVRTLRNFTEHYAIGEAVVRHLCHLEKLASLVPADRITRTSEKMARQGGFRLSVFTHEGDALAWLRSEDP